MLAGQWWHTPLNPALERQRQADFWVRGQPGLQSEFQDSQGCTEKPCLKKTKQKQKNKKTNNKRHGICSRSNKTWWYTPLFLALEKCWHPWLHSELILETISGGWDGSKPDNLNLTPGNHTVAWKNCLLQVALWPPHMHTYNTHAHKHAVPYTMPYPPHTNTGV